MAFLGKLNDISLDPVYQIVYLSTASERFGKSELRFLLKESCERNAKAEITGLLLYKDGHFMQVLEGPEAAVKETHKRISCDVRHHGLIVLLQGFIEKRQFPDFSMAFRDLSMPENMKIPGYNEFLNTPLTEGEFSSDASRCERLLLAFKKHIR